MLSLGAVAALAIAFVNARELGGSDPKNAANYRLPLFNFSETYTDGVVLGVTVGSTRAEAIAAAEGGGFQVSPSGWGDNRAGGADLYDRPELVAMMRRQPYLMFNSADSIRGGMIIEFQGDRVAAVQVHYINNEVI